MSLLCCWGNAPSHQRAGSSQPFIFTSTTVHHGFVNMYISQLISTIGFCILVSVISFRPLHKKRMAFLLKLAPLKIVSVNGGSPGLQPWTTFKSSVCILYSEINSLPPSLEWPTILCLFFTPIRLCQTLWHPHLFTAAGSNLVSLCKSPPIHSLLQSNCFHPSITCITLNGSPVS